MQVIPISSCHCSFVADCDGYVLTISRNPINNKVTFFDVKYGGSLTAYVHTVTLNGVDVDSVCVFDNDGLILQKDDVVVLELYPPMFVGAMPDGSNFVIHSHMKALTNCIEFTKQSST